MDTSEIVVSKHGTTFVGPDGVSVFRAISLRFGLRMYAACGMRPNRAWTPTAMLKAAGQITGKTYKRGAYVAAAEDLDLWIEAMKAAIPISSS